MISLLPITSSLTLHSRQSSTALLAVSIPSHRRFLLLPFSIPSLNCLLLSKHSSTPNLLFFLQIFKIFPHIMVSNIISTLLVLLFLLKPAALIPSVSNRPRLNLLSWRRLVLSAAPIALGRLLFILSPSLMALGGLAEITTASIWPLLLIAILFLISRI